MTAPSDTLEMFLNERLESTLPVSLERLTGGGSCEIFALDRGDDHWVLRRAPRHASSATAHDVLREFRILDAIKDGKVPLARPILACEDPSIFESPFYVMERIDGVPIRSSVPAAWTTAPTTQGRALEVLIDTLADIHAIDWEGCGLGDLAQSGPTLQRQISRWLSQLESYGSRSLEDAGRVGAWLSASLPPEHPRALIHGDYKLDNVLYARTAPPDLLAVVDWEMAAIGDPLIDLAWAMIFHPAGGTTPLGMGKEPTFTTADLPSKDDLVDRYRRATGRDTSSMAWYDVFARWKLGIVLEGSYAKFLRGESSNPIHEFFGRQAERLLDDAVRITAGET
jgi:aminoglycoside phosphotransferase (APT) family kinase protein